VPHQRWRRVAIGLLSMLAALALVITFSGAITLYMVLVLPVLLGLGGFILVQHLRRQAAPQASAQPPASLPTRKVTLHRLRDTGA